MIGAMIVSVLGYGLSVIFMFGAWGCAKEAMDLKEKGEKEKADVAFKGAGVGVLCAFLFSCLTLVITRGAI